MPLDFGAALMPFETVPTGFCALPPERCQFDHSRVVVLPIPYDMTTSYVAGTRLGPQAIIEASRHLETFDNELLRDVSDLGIYTAEPLAADSRGPSWMMDAITEATRMHLRDNRFVLALGGEHSLSFGCIRAQAEKHPELGVFQLDAHLDLRAEYEQSQYNHACVMRRVHEDLGLPIAQLGIRSFSEEEHAYLNKHQLAPITAREWVQENKQGRQKRLQRLIDTLPPKVYLTIDLDVFDPAYIPATGTPEPGGLDWYSVVSVIEQLAQSREIVGADLVELAPIAGQVASDFLAAKLAYRLIGLVCSNQDDD